MQRYWEWYYATINATPPDQRAAPPDCTRARDDDAWFLSVDVAGSVNGKPCSIPRGATLVFPVVHLLAVGGHKSCDAVIPQIRSQMDAAGSPGSVSLDGGVLPSTALWRSTSRECFPLETPLGGFGVKRRGDAEPELLTYAYSDGYWMILTLLRSGTHVLQIRGQQWNGAFHPVEATYNLQVTD